jgi:fatty acid desaturase
MSTALSANPARELNTPDMQRRVNALRDVNNLTNWFYLLREYLMVTLMVGLALAFYHWREDWGLAWAWNIPVTLLAITLIGAGQHRLTTLGHEASHYMLFRNRTLNELVSDWFCFFPIYSTTQNYRLQHLAHHQFPNDPDRDPDVTQMEMSGHRYRFPMKAGKFLWECLLKPAIWLPGLVKYSRARATYAATGGGGGPYAAKGPRSRSTLFVGIAYMFTLFAAVNFFAWLGEPLWLVLVPTTLYAAALTYYLLIPDRLFRRSLLKYDVPIRLTTCLRITHMTLVFTIIGWLTYLTGKPWAVYYIVLWIVPLFTSFSFYMLMRQIVQHGNASRERLTNTRIFHVQRLIQLACFPLGMDYHLPHHLFPMIPHYRLRQLHKLLMETEVYREQATIVDGYVLHRETPPVHPTVVELMSREMITAK